ncbi:FMN-binding negative transcriptional regulator [Pararhodobacter marinus]|uniref:FMN-binding negative transcriptional regulator n=1 Tax=Pararhodobacter marinus TaxID=2184063 RepID=UPI00351875C3
MYNPTHFTETDQAEIERLIHACPLAAVVAQTGDGLNADHLPLLRDGAGFLGHVALANPMHRTLPDGAPVLAIFRAGDAYVSPNWYPSKAETHKAVPTWNYQVVQVHGTIRWSHEDKDKRRAVALLTARHEKETNGKTAWRMGDAPEDFLVDMLARIVAFRIEVTRIEAKSKLNQNRSVADIDAVAQALESRGNHAVAQAMRRATKG